VSPWHEHHTDANEASSEISLSGQWFFQSEPIIDDSDSEGDSDDEDDEDPDLIEQEFGLYDPETGLLGGEITENVYDESDSDDGAVEDSTR
jgi:hypothetical protein